MKYSFLKIYLAISTTFFFFNCKQSTSPSELPVSAPSRNLPASEIMKLQGITSIHYVDYDSVVINGDPDDGFVANCEFFIETNRMKMSQYYLGTPNWNTTVYDLNKDSAWNNYSGQLTFPQYPNLQVAFDMNIQAYLGSWLKDPITYLGTEYVGDKLCNVFKDSTSYQEWVWIKHRIPIQRRREGSHNNIHQISVSQKRNIEVNVQFSNSIFEPPR